MSQQAFADLGASRPVVDALAARGYEEPFPVQRLVIPDVLEGRDVLVKSPTGSGKTLAFGVPLVDLIEATDPRPSALVLVPTRELAGQIVDELHSVAHSRALSIAAVYGGAGIERQSKLARRAHILVATPGRLEDLIDRRAFSLEQIKVLVLDEADRMLDMGFRPAVDRIVRLTPRDRQTLFFSATLDGAAGEVADAVTRDSKLDTLVSELREPGRKLVFVRTKHGADRLVKRLKARSINAVAMHGNKTQSQREKALARFERGDVDTLVATDVAARGLDIDHVAHVINFDPPADRDGYIHRVGRTGRAEAIGDAFTFVSPEEEGNLRDIERAISRRLPRVTVPDFDYSAKVQARLEVPLAERIAEIRARKRDERARAAVNAARRSANQRGQAPPAAPQPAGRPHHGARPGQHGRPSRFGGPRRGPGGSGGRPPRSGS
jgi:ATP-dependent RNA helicase RhlE